MAVVLKDKMGETRIVVVTWGEDTVDVSYYPNVVTPAHMEKIDAAAQKDDLSILGVLLEPVLEWWDVLDTKGKRIPTTANQIKDIPLNFLNLVQRAIQEDQNPPEGGTSDAG